MSSSSGIVSLFALLIVLFFVFLAIYLYYLVVKTAQKRGRSGLWWFILSLVFTPLLALILLFLIGDKE